MSTYDAPNVLKFVGALFRLVRHNYARDFAGSFASSSDGELRQSYHDGIVFLVCLLASMVVLWGIILVGIKLSGERLECAAGYAFKHTSGLSERQSSETSASNDDVWENERPWDGGATSHDMDRAQFPPVHGNDVKASIEEETLSYREKRVQVCFFLFGIALLVSIIMIFSLALNPMIQAIDESVVFIKDSREVVNEMTNALSALSNASYMSLDLVTNMELNVSKLCPNVTSVEVEHALDVDLESLLLFLNADYRSLAVRVSANVADGIKVLEASERGISIVERCFDLVNRYLWVIPTVLITLSVVTVIVLTGCFLSRTRQSTGRFQLFLSFAALPGLVIISLLCWLTTFAAAALTSLGSDVCLTDSLSGSPAQTILNVLRDRNVSDSSLLYAYTTDFTIGCNSSRASEFIPSLQAEVQTIIDFIDESISKVDAVGLVNLLKYCTAGDELGVFILQAEDLTESLPFVQQALEESSQALSCNLIHRIYEHAVNETMCVTLTGSVAWSFILFLIAGISSMGLITLRSAWQHQMSEEVIFEENEVAENMILDEHEEYLLYISKYRHEWEEYHGVDIATAFRVDSTESLDSETFAPPHTQMSFVQDSPFGASIRAFYMTSEVTNPVYSPSQSTVFNEMRSLEASVMPEGLERDDECNVQAFKLACPP